MITLKRFRRIEAAVRAAGYADTIDWSENIMPPANAREFAKAAIYVICNSGMRTTVAKVISNRCLHALAHGASSYSVFKHPGKAAAIDLIWTAQKLLFKAFMAADDKLEFCQSLPWIGPVTRHHLAKNLGVDTAKQDLHLHRLAEWEDMTAIELCTRLARQSGFRIATVDTILWRACVESIIDSKRYQEQGWRGSFNGFQD